MTNFIQYASHSKMKTVTKALFSPLSNNFSFSEDFVREYEKLYPTRPVQGEGRFDQELIKLFETIGTERSCEHQIPSQVVDYIHDVSIPSDYVLKSIEVRADNEPEEHLYLHRGNIAWLMVQNGLLPNVDHIKNIQVRLKSCGATNQANQRSGTFKFKTLDHPGYFVQEFS